ncbi:dihydrodipicolinate synthase family protein [Nocardia brasiliensis]|uniref:dihydrodipicolinate synthase family protein n=1 Tax=Nocardia brasiliensis TaxID=37326 RepID=UPI00189343BB|nr:dihydrodipicolinate synthase family protein [Nocardia brasiliensis]MBF6129819.1 dihydrodipicolinate synthase family protein [Nocardia brasiliensis]
MTLITRETAGVFAIAPTPFDEDGAVDFDSLGRLVDFYESVGVAGLTLLGQLGEAPKLAHEESTRIVRHVLERTSLPIVVGVSASGYAAMAALTTEVMDAGAAGVMIAPPNTLRTDDQIVQYYAGAAHMIGDSVPIVIQDYPLSFSVVMTPSVIARIAVAAPNCVMLKHEDWPGLEKISTLRRLEGDGQLPRLSILCGNGGLFLDFEIERGADGAMTGYCFPELLVDIVEATAANRDSAHDLFDAHLPLIRYEQQPVIGLAVRKYIMKRRGLLTTDAQRSPRPVLTDTSRAEIDYLLARLSRHDPRVELVK